MKRLAFTLGLLLALCAGDVGAVRSDPPAVDSVAIAPRKITAIVAPAKVQAGELVILEAASADAKAFRWLSLPDLGKNFLPIDGGKRAVFATGTPGRYVFVLATATGDALDLSTVTVTVGDPPPAPPGPGPQPDPVVDLSASIKTWAEKVRPENRAAEAVKLANAFSGIAAAIAAGAIKTPEDVLAAQVQANRQALGESATAWAPFFADLRDALNKLAEAGKLSSLESHATTWRQIAAGLAEVK